jgi:glycosyltransferase involved in cell wall biosynthesis
VPVHLVPSPAEIIGKFVPLPHIVYLRGITVWDRAVAALMPKADLVIGLATCSLATGRAARRRGGRFALDRACPHVDFQQNLVRNESEAVGARFNPEPAWFHERQIAEYETADIILTPSDYTARSFPAGLREKCVVAPLLGRATAKGEIRLARNTPFTVGVLGGHPLRKGYLYLLEAWKRLALPDARLIIRSSANFAQFPRLAELLKELPNVEVIDYIPNIAEFYQRCDLFVLPSVDDGFGMALFEAMANGVPSISTRNCGASELLVDGRDGLIIDARSVDQLVASILKLYENETLRQEIAVAGQQAVARITTQRVYETVLSNVLHGVEPRQSSILSPASQGH